LKCGRCGLAFRSLRPNLGELAQRYRDADDSLYEAEFRNRFKTAHRQRRILERFTECTGTLIDVECASGAFMQVMADNGWKVTSEPLAGTFRKQEEVSADLVGPVRAH
jgi:hypothetical protein